MPSPRRKATRGRGERGAVEGEATRNTGEEEPPIAASAGGQQRTGYLGLGSNVGDRVAHLRRAVEELPVHGVEVEALSSLYETEPVGEVTEQPDFLNAVTRMRTELEPQDLLQLCKAIEAEHGRMFGSPRHGPRPLDLDLLLLGDMELQTGRLTLPHPEITRRRFVLVPLLELDPELTLPDGTRLAESLERLGPGQRVERVGALA